MHFVVKFIMIWCFAFKLIKVFEILNKLRLCKIIRGEMLLLIMVFQRKNLYFAIIYFIYYPVLITNSS